VEDLSRGMWLQGAMNAGPRGAESSISALIEILHSGCGQSEAVSTRIYAVYPTFRAQLAFSLSANRRRDCAARVNIKRYLHGRGCSGNTGMARRGTNFLHTQTAKMVASPAEFPDAETRFATLSSPFSGNLKRSKAT
jgi:hypothetical protein